MDIGLLRAFLEIHRLRHFGRAAKNLFISQSAISARVRQLEDELGTRLFTRERNNIELTPALRANVGRLALSFLNNCGGSAYLPAAMVSSQMSQNQGKTLYKVKDAAVIDKAAYAVFSPANSKREILESALNDFTTPE